MRLVQIGLDSHNLTGFLQILDNLTRFPGIESKLHNYRVTKENVVTLIMIIILSERKSPQHYKNRFLVSLKTQNCVTEQ